MDFLAGIYIGGFFAYLWGLLQSAPEFAANTGRALFDQVLVTVMAASVWPGIIALEALGMTARWWRRRGDG